METIVMKALHDMVEKAINGSPIMAGVAMLVLNIGSRYIDLGITPTQEALMRSEIAREILIFAMAFVATKEIVLSILLTAAFLTLSNHVLNESSPYCACPGYMASIKAYIDSNQDGVITNKEIDAGLAALQKLKRMNNK